MVNQIEFCPYAQHEEQVNFCQKLGIQIMAWAPLGKGQVLDNTIIQEIGKGHNASIAQVCISYCVQKKIPCVVKSSNEGRLKENLKVVSLDESDMLLLDCMERGFLADEYWDHSKVL